MKSLLEVKDLIAPKLVEQADRRKQKPEEVLEAEETPNSPPFPPEE